MKIIITESQKNKFIDTSIQETLSEIKKSCDNLDADNFPDWMSFSYCDICEDIEKIEVVNTQMGTKKYDLLLGKSYPAFKVWIKIFYNNLKYKDFDGIDYIFRNRIFEKYKIRVDIIIDDQINTNTNKEW